ncbi:MAG: rhomboid family intramembrane serine protease [Pseudomonadota bacterium]
MNGTNGSGNGTNGSGHHHDDDDDDNVVALPTLAERDKMRREARKEAERIMRKREPMIRMPEATKYMLGTFVVIHILLALLPALREWTILNLGFVPASFTGGAPFTIYTLITPLTYMLIHGSWLHLAMNGFMMAAFGSGVEKWLGAKRMIFFFVMCSLCGIALHFVAYSSSMNPVVGASGGLSGMFAAALVMLNSNAGPGNMRQRILPFALLWIGISLLFGLMGGPDGSSIAWVAHIGGFLGGFLVLKGMKVF